MDRSLRRRASSLCTIACLSLTLAGCSDGETDTGETPDAAASADGTDSDVDGADSDADGPDVSRFDIRSGDTGDDSSGPWWEREPEPSGDQTEVAGFVVDEGSEQTHFQTLVDGDGGLRLIDDSGTLQGQNEVVAQTQKLALIDQGEGERLLLSRPWNVTEPIHTIDIGDEIGSPIADAVYDDRRRTTYLVAYKEPTLFAIDHGAEGDQIRPLDLSRDGANPDPEALALDGETLLVGLSRLHPPGERSSEDMGEPAQVAVVEPESMAVEASVDLPHTDVSAGIEPLPDGDFAVGVAGDSEPDGQGNLRTDGGIYRLQASDDGTYRLREELLSENQIKTDLADFAFGTSTTGIVEGFQVRGTSLQRFDLGGESASLTSYRSSRWFTPEGWCASSDGSTLGTATIGGPLLSYENGATRHPDEHTPSSGEANTCLLVESGG